MTDYKASKRIVGTSAERLATIESTTTITDNFTPQLTWGQTGDKYSIDNNKVECAGYSNYAPNDFVYHDLGVGYHAFDNDWTYRIIINKHTTNYGYAEFGITSDISNGDAGSMIEGSVNKGGGSNYMRINGAYGGSYYEHTTGSAYSALDNTPVYCELKFVKSTGVVSQKAFTNSDYSTGQIGSTLNYTITSSNYSGMRYIFIGAMIATGRSDSSSTYADDFSFTYTASVTPNIQTNSIWEESDTGKHYIWSGSAWVEVA